VRIPDARSGVHVLLATDGKGQIARGAFEVNTGAPTEGTSSPAYRTDATAAPSTDWLRIGMNLLAVGLLAAVPLVALGVLARRPVLAGAARTEG
jgi:hypothetical protein